MNDGEEMQTFEEWLALNHPEILDEDWRDLGKKIALGGTLLGAGLGIGRMTIPGSDHIPSESETTPQAAEYLPGKAKPSSAMQRWQQTVKKYDREQAKRQKGGPKEIKSSSGTVDDASDYIK